MKTLKELRQERARISALLDGMNLNATSTDADLEAAEKHQADITALDRRIAVLTQTEALRARGATAGGAFNDDAGNGDDEGNGQPGANDRAPAQPKAPHEPGILFAQATRALVVGKGRVNDAHSFAARTWGESSPVAMEIGAAMQSNDATGGGFLIPEKFSTEIIDLLMPKTTIRRLTAAQGGVVPLVGGTDTIPTVESGITAYYNGEGQDITASEPSFGSMKMSEREIVALVPMSNKLLRHAALNVDRMVRDLILRGMAQAEDLAFLRGTGNGPGPKGLRFQMNAANVLPATAGTMNAATIDADARRLELLMMEADIPMIAPTWLMTPRAALAMADLRSGSGDTYQYPSMGAERRTFRGKPVEITNNVPRNLGGGFDQEIYLVDFAYVMIADSFQVRIDASDTASYKQGSELVSAFSRNQTVIKATGAHDFGLTRTRAASCLTGVTWGN